MTADLARQRSAQALNERLRVDRTDRIIGQAGMNLPRTRAIGTLLGKLAHGIEARAEKVHQRVAATESKADAVFAGVNQHLDASEASLDEINGQLDAVAAELGGNGGPLAESQG